MKVEEDRGKADLKLNIQKTKIIAPSPIISRQTDGGKNANSNRLYFLGLPNHCSECIHEIKTLAPWNKSYDKPRQCIKKQDITLPTKVHIVKAMFFFWKSSIDVRVGP